MLGISISGGEKDTGFFGQFFVKVRVGKKGEARACHSFKFLTLEMDSLDKNNERARHLFFGPPYFKS